MRVLGEYCVASNCFVLLRRLGVAFAVAVCLPAATAQAAFTAILQGQSSGSTNWVPGILSGWNELDLIPVRVWLTGGPANSQIITVQFDHTGIQNLSSFTPSPNVVMTSVPTLGAP